MKHLKLFEENKRNPTEVRELIEDCFLEFLESTTDDVSYVINGDDITLEEIREYGDQMEDDEDDEYKIEVYYHCPNEIFPLTSFNNIIKWKEFQIEKIKRFNSCLVRLKACDVDNILKCEITSTEDSSNVYITVEICQNK